MATAGSGSGQVAKARGLAVDATSALLYVADSENFRVDAFDAESGEFVQAYGWGVADGATSAFQHCSATCFPGLPGSGAGQLRLTRGIAVDNDPGSPSQHAVYVGDPNNARVQKFDSNGDFVLAFGDGVNETTGEDVCTAASGDTCGAGVSGEAAGQFNGIGGVAVGAGGVVYVADRVGAGAAAQSRVQRFSAAGAFLGQALLLVAGGAGGTNAFTIDSEENLLVGTAGSSGAVRKYTPAGELLWTGNPSFNINSLAVNAAGRIFVGDVTNVFSSSAEFPPGITAPGAGVVNEYDSVGTQLRAFYGALVNQSNVIGLAAFSGPGGDIFVSEGSAQQDRLLHTSFPPAGPVVYPEPKTVFAKPIGNVKATLNAKVNPEGKPTTFHFEYVDQQGFEEGAWASPAVQESTESASIGSDFLLHPAVQQVTGLTPETVYHFRAVPSNADAPGGSPGPEATFETEPPIAFGATWATSVGSDSATLHGEANPLGIAANGYFEYVDDVTFQASGFAEAAKAPAGPPLDFGAGEALVARSALASALDPGTTYHYRLVASDNCKPAEPSVVCTFNGPERTLRTFAPVSPPATSCPANAAFRLDAAAYLADCRGYEMVSPVDKNGTNIEVVFNLSGYPAGLDQSALDGQTITYSAYRSFAEPEAAPYSSQYLATRGENSWQSKSIAPPREGPALYNNTAGLDYQFKAFTADLCSGWPLQDTANPLLAAGAVAGYPNLYRRDNCEPGAGAYEAVTTVAPLTALEPRLFFPELQEFSAEGAKAFFSAKARLTPQAKAGISQAYEASAGGLALVCILPNGSVSSSGCALGGGEPGVVQRNANVAGAASADGSIAYWREGENNPGKLYVRLDGQETVQVSAQAAQFWTAAADGSRAIYTVGEKLFVFDLATKASTPIAEGVQGVAGASEDATQFYFGSTKDLATGATAGELNLYGHLGGAIRFIGTLTAVDGGENRISPISDRPFLRTARVTPDGNRIVFMSKASLTGYDNVDAASGEADSEVFLYDATANGGTGQLRCLSCNPTEGRPVGARWTPVKNKYKFSESWVAAFIPAWENQLYAPRVISDDGSRVFFNSFDRLVARDTNGRQDVYQWEAPGAGDCAQGGQGFLASAGGCISLISSGQSPGDSELTDSSATGGDVFFKTASSLAPQDPGLLDIYDARVGGGFPPPPAPPVECEGEACQHPAAAPEDPTPGSSTFVGPGNPATPVKPKPKPCPKGKHKVKKNGKTRCVKNKKGAKKHRRHRGASR